LGDTAGIPVSDVASLQEEIADLRSLLDGLPQDVRGGPFGAVYERRLEHLQTLCREAELHDAADAAGTPAMNLRIWGDVARQHRVPAQLLSKLLDNWQTLCWELSMAPTTTGKPPLSKKLRKQVKRESMLEVEAHTPGSFVARMVVAPTQQTSTAGTEDRVAGAFARFQKLCGSPGYGDLSEQFHVLRGRVLVEYMKLLRLLDQWDASLDISLAEPNSEHLSTVQLDLPRVRVLLPLLNRVSASTVSEDRYVNGILIAADRANGQFKVEVDLKSISGKAQPVSVLQGTRIGATYELHLSKVVSTDPLTGAEGEAWTLHSMTIVDSPQ
jgi:hypothetical protein